MPSKPKPLKDAEKVFHSPLKDKAKHLLDLLEENPYASPPSYEKLIGDLSGAYSRCMNIQHRLVCQILSEAHVVKILKMGTQR